MTSAELISVVMIGCGNFSRRYHVPTLEADPGVTFAGIFDPSPSDGVRELADRTGAALVADARGAAGAGRQRRWPSSPRRTHCTPITSPSPCSATGTCCATSPSS